MAELMTERTAYRVPGMDQLLQLRVRYGSDPDGLAYALATTWPEWYRDFTRGYAPVDRAVADALVEVLAP